MISIINAQDGKIVEIKKWIFNKRNINKIAYNYDCEVIKFDKNRAWLKDGYGRKLYCDDQVLLKDIL